jgi:hypothetical protein
MMFLVEQDENPTPSPKRDLSRQSWWCNFVSGIMMPKFLFAVKSATRALFRG